jgi:hypothetical protein
MKVRMNRLETKGRLCHDTLGYILMFGKALLNFLLKVRESRKRKPIKNAKEDILSSISASISVQFYLFLYKLLK